MSSGDSVAAALGARNRGVATGGDPGGGSARRDRALLCRDRARPRRERVPAAHVPRPLHGTDGARAPCGRGARGHASGEPSGSGAGRRNRADRRRQRALAFRPIRDRGARVDQRHALRRRHRDHVRGIRILRGDLPRVRSDRGGDRRRDGAVGRTLRPQAAGEGGAFRPGASHPRGDGERGGGQDPRRGRGRSHRAPHHPPHDTLLLARPRRARRLGRAGSLGGRA